MSDYFLGEIRMFPFDWAPKNWHLCDGTLMAIQQNQALYALIGIQFGGDGKTTFALPDLRGRAIQHTFGTGTPVGTKAGSETVALTAANLPAHTHQFVGTTQEGILGGPGGGGGLKTYAVDGGKDVNCYAAYNQASAVAMNTLACGVTGGGAGHNNMQPYLVTNYCICTSGIFPPRQ